MEIPIALRDAIETFAVGQPRAQLTLAAQKLSERYRGESGGGKRLLTRDAEAAAYAAARMPATYCAVLSALRQSLMHCDIGCTSLLDVGAGTGAACWAALEAMPNIRQITCVEREAAMRRAGQRLAEAGPEPLRNVRWLDIDLAKESTPQTADLVIASYVLGEMTEENRAKTAETLWSAAGKMLLIVEPGTPAGYEQVRALRSLLLSRGAHIAAPCPHVGPCPIPEGDWCHFACRVPRSRLHRALKGGDAPYEDEKFCYMAFTKQPGEHVSARVLRHPQVEPGRVTLTLCTPEGIKKSIVTKRDGEAFKRARKAVWGHELSE
jgi:ribosomal protein RSM22 (predicted rRNA methylase)